jgi:GNAT superfamily N-acetyltransferase
VIQHREITTRRAESKDVDAVAGLWHESARGMDGVPMAKPTRSALQERIIAELRSGWDLYLAHRGERLVGMLALKPEFAIVDQIFVAPGEQRKGVGSALLDLAKRSLPAGFTLRMDAANHRARRFYQKEGLKKVDEGIHPSTGIPVHYYGWNIRSGS